MIVRTLLIAVLTCSVAAGQARLTRDEALALQFPGAQVRRATVFLTDEQQREVQQKAKAAVESKLVTYYEARIEGRLNGVAFFETQIVRTMPATFMVVVNPDSTIRTVEILAFNEPPDYLPPNRWLAQYAGKRTEDDLMLRRGIRSIAGATLTAQTISNAVRRLLTVYTTVVAKELQR